MSEPYLIGLVGARGHAGRELIRLISGHPEMMLAYAVSREWAGRKVSEVAPEDKDECIFEALDPKEAARRRVDAVIL
ncbi:MAG: N-acetyl-gamma-glutamyl-phosphate reductase, partial [Pseudomonadota bacterium]